MDSIIKDIRYALRTLMMRPAFTFVAVLTLGLGIGANTAIFSVVNAVLLQALPYPAPEQLVSIKKSPNAGGIPGLAAYEYLAWRDRSKSFAEVAAYSDDNFNLTGLGEPERISCAQVTASLFPLLGVQPVQGRVFSQEEDRPAAAGAIVVSEGFWQRRYGRNPAMVGSAVTLNDKKYTIVGVLPASFRFPGEYEIWMPMALDPVVENRGETFTLIDVAARLKPGISIQGAQADIGLILQQVSEQSQAQGKEALPRAIVDVTPLHRELVAGIRRTVLVLWGAVGLVLLIACANVASLMLARTLGRQREIAVRAAVGARRWQLIRQLLTESVLLGLAGGVLGVLLAMWSTNALASLIPTELANTINNFKGIAINRQMLVFTVLVSIGTGIIFGLAPALSSSRPDLVKTLREGAGYAVSGFGWRSLRGWLVVAELALALVLLLSAGLMIKSFARLSNVETGFNKDKVLTARINLPRSRYGAPAKTAAFYKDLVKSVQLMPGVEVAGAISHTPLKGFSQIRVFRIEGQPDPVDRHERMIPVGLVTPDYFRTLEIKRLSGRDFDEHDTPAGNPVTIVNEEFARKFFPNDNPIGKRVSAGCPKDELCREIVGVVGNIRQNSLTEAVSPEIYLSYQQSPGNGMTIVLRSNGNPANLAGSLRSEVSAIDSSQPVYDVKALSQRVDEAMASTRSLMFLFGGFATLALVLATVGIYGVVSYSVGRRTREIGIRMALGAQAHDVLRLVIKNGMTLTLIGVLIGLGGAFALTRLLATLLFGVPPTDPGTFLMVSMMLTAVALVACYIPARRAAKVNPIIALRDE
jgi:putative ABC transport system permease protein